MCVDSWLVFYKFIEGYDVDKLMMRVVMKFREEVKIIRGKENGGREVE